MEDERIELLTRENAELRRALNAIRAGAESALTERPLVHAQGETPTFGR